MPANLIELNLNVRIKHFLYIIKPGKHNRCKTGHFACCLALPLRDTILCKFANKTVLGCALVTDQFFSNVPSVFVTQARKNREISSLQRKIDEVPSRAELTQYQRRFVELYNHGL